MFLNKYYRSMVVVASLCTICFLARAGDTIQTTGITAPLNDVSLGFPDAGIIHAEFFQEGDSVKKGDVILELDKSLEAIEVTRTKIAMDQTQEIYKATLQLSQTTKSVSQEDLDKAEAGYREAEADYQTAVQKLAEKQLIAPFSGTINDITLKPGAVVAPYTPFVRLVDTSQCYFIGHVDGATAVKIQLNQPVQITVDGGQTVAGKICFISPVVDAASGLARIKAIFDNTDGKIRPGVSATLTTQ